MAATKTPGKHKTVRNAANSGDQRRLLVALRNLIADSLDSGKVSPRDLAALTKRIDDISKEIAAIDAQSKEGDHVVESVTIPDEPLS
ncbi:MAG: hypothetical protein LKJ47_04860 [Bifidobacteriaceae bacterium]|nr:hypothetical protein [Bifidobacteriaceae bacterium]